MLRIREILVRIRIRGSGHLTNGSGSSCFCLWPSRQLNVFCLLIFEATFTSFFKDKKRWRSQKTVFETKIVSPDTYSPKINASINRLSRVPSWANQKTVFDRKNSPRLLPYLGSHGNPGVLELLRRDTLDIRPEAVAAEGALGRLRVAPAAQALHLLLHLQLLLQAV